MGRLSQINDKALQKQIDSLARPGDNYGNKRKSTIHSDDSGLNPTSGDLANLKNLGNTTPMFVRYSPTQRFAEYTDVVQCDWANCNYLSALCAFAKNSPIALRNSIAREHNSDNTRSYTVTLYDKNSAGDLKPVKVKVEASEINWNSAKVKDGRKEIWSQIIMTAVGKLNGFRNVKTGGGFVEALETLTGRKAQRFNLSEDPLSFEKLQENLQNGKNVVIGSKTNVKQVRENPFGIEPWHGYAVVGASVNKNGRQIAELYDPAQGQTIKVPFDKLDNYFNEIVVN